LTHRSSWNDVVRVTTDQTDVVLFITRLLRTAVAAASSVGAPAAPASEDPTATATATADGGNDATPPRHGDDGEGSEGGDDGGGAREPLLAGGGKGDHARVESRAPGGGTGASRAVGFGLRRRKPAALATSHSEAGDGAVSAAHRTTTVNERSFRGSAGGSGVITTRGGGVGRALGEHDADADDGAPSQGMALASDEDATGPSGSSAPHRPAAMLPISLVSTLLRWPAGRPGSAEDSEEELTGGHPAHAHGGEAVAVPSAGTSNRSLGRGSGTGSGSRSGTPLPPAPALSTTAAPTDARVAPGRRRGAGGGAAGGETAGAVPLPSTVPAQSATGSTARGKPAGGPAAATVSKRDDMDDLS